MVKCAATSYRLGSEPTTKTGKNLEAGNACSSCNVETLQGGIAYLLDRHGDMIQYVLLGKIQSDRIEGRSDYPHIKGNH